MKVPNIATPVHSYDTGQHRIVCGVRGVEHRSTKHSRSVTCPACVALLHRAAPAPSSELAALAGA